MLARLLAVTAVLCVRRRDGAGAISRRQRWALFGGQTSKRYEFFGGMSYVGSIKRSTVAAPGNYSPGTIIVNTGERRLYLVQDNGTALRYGIGVGRDGFTWTGTSKVVRQEGMAELDAAAADARAPAGPAAPHEGRPGESARRARHVSRRARSIASTARTSRRRSARPSRRAASA